MWYCREGDWDLYWCDVGWMKEYFDHYYMEEHMKLCHFRNHYEVIIIITSPQSNLRRVRRKGPIGSDDIVRFKPKVLAEYSNSKLLG